MRATSIDRQKDLGSDSFRQTHPHLSVGNADGDGTLWRGNTTFSLCQVASPGAYFHLLKCRRCWPDAHQTERNDIGRGGTPRMIPVLIGFPFVAPGFHCYGRTFSYHVRPTAVALACHQRKGGIRFAQIVESLKQKLCAIDAASHSARLDVGGNRGSV